jgi:hypothetical protein
VAERQMNPQHEDFICFYREAVIAGHDAPAAETMRRFNLSRDYTIRLLNGTIAGCDGQVSETGILQREPGKCEPQ